MDKLTISSVAIIGAGTMGRGIAYLFALNGIKTVLYSRSENKFEYIKNYISKDLEKRIARGKIASQKKKEVLSNIVFSSTIKDIENCDLIIETVVENEIIKRELLKTIASVVKPQAIIATNTSSLSLNKLAADIENNVRFIGLHFFNPAHLMRLVEIIPSYFTDIDTIKFCQRLILSINRKYVVCKPTPGFIVNRMARPFYLEGFRLLEENVAQAAQIDRALKSGGHFRMGPLKLTDFIGQDINYQVSQQIWQDLQYDPRYTPSQLQRSLVDAGLSGKKNNRSFFTSKTTIPLPVASPVQTTPAISLCFYGEHPLFTQLQQRIREESLAVRFETMIEHDQLGCFVKVNEKFIIKVTDGRTAHQLEEMIKLDCFIIDMSLDYAHTDYFVAAYNLSATENNKQIFLSLLNLVVPYIDFIKDSPGLVVARVLTSLINESVIMVERNICSREDIEIAASDGVNYTSSPLNWLVQIGHKEVKATLGNMAKHLHSTRYCPHCSLLYAQQPALAPVL